MAIIKINIIIRKSSEHDCEPEKHSVMYDTGLNLSLSDILIKNNIIVNTPCGGNGLCGKCNVVINGASIKSCTYFPCDSDNNICIELPEESLISYDNTINDSDSFSSTSELNSEISKNVECHSKKIAVDIGSTSITMCITDSNKVIDTLTFLNPTASYGADVVSRIQASINGKKEALQASLINGLTTNLKRITSKNRLNITEFTDIYIACNSTMEHLLYGLDCKGLSSYPFTLSKAEKDLYILGLKVVTFPHFSAFVGGDIMSGLYYIDDNEPYILLDLGTNAEMALYNKGTYYVTSASAGPAFEGTSISCGCAYVPGAINNISVSPARASSFRCTYNTIDNKLPTGICGSGIVMLYSELIRLGIVDNYGTLCDNYIDIGFPVANTPVGQLTITQNDIRQLILALAAIKSGLQILLKKSGCNPRNIKKIYISGSFGKALNTDILSNINMFPDELLKGTDICFSGNTSLKGAIKYSMSHDSENDATKVQNIISNCQEIHLANEETFEKIFIGNMVR
jgi:uncharacterized metal-binding protein